MRGTAIALFFVLLWSTGFIGAKLGAPYAEPFTFLALRFAIVTAVFAVVVYLFARSAMNTKALLHSFVTGLLLHGIYLGGVFYAIDRGMSAGVSALIVSLQPLITAVIMMGIFGQRFGMVRLFWMVFGLFGVSLVLAPKIWSGANLVGMGAGNLAIVFVSAIAISAGTIYQKRYLGAVDLRVGALGQYASAFVLMGILALFTETMKVQWSGEFIFALGWLVIVLSFGAVGLLMKLIRSNDINNVASLFFLVPASTAFIGYLMFDERLEVIQVIGSAFVMIAVAMFVRREKFKSA